MSKKILYQEEARRALEKGIEIITEAVAITLGPKGRNVVLEKKYGAPQIVNDGVTIAKEIAVKDHVENTGISLIKEAASKTNDVAGDGTTTATVLASAMIKYGMKNVTAGSNPMTLRKGMDKAGRFASRMVLEYAKPVKDSHDLIQIASISAGNDEAIGAMVARTLEKVGKYGIVSLEEGKSTEIELETTEGMRFEKGYISPYFITDKQRRKVNLENPYILITDKKITLVEQELMPILERISKTGRPLLIIADDVEKEALTTLVINKLRGLLKVAAVKAPAFGDRRKNMLEDIAILTGAQVISEDTGFTLETTELKQLGQSRRVNISKESTTIIADGNSEEVQRRCEQLKQQITVTDSGYEKEKLHERLAKISGDVAIIKVGAATETEMKDRKLRLEDAINATRAAVEEGIVPGGGLTLARVANEIYKWRSRDRFQGDELVGILIVEQSLTAPLKRIAQNAGKNGAVIIGSIKDKEFSCGYDAATNSFVDMYESGIIDPAKVVRSTIENATSIASMVVTTECLIVDSPN